MKNSGKTSIVVKKIEASCGCLSSGWKGGILPPNELREFSVIIIPNSWGTGRRKRTFTFELGDGSSKVFDIEGEGLSDEVAQEMNIAPRIFRIDCTDFGPGEKRISRESNITFDHNERGRLEIMSSVPWLNGEIENLTSTSALLKMNITIDFNRLEAGPILGQGVLTVTNRKDFPGIPIKIELYRRELIRPNPSILQLSKSRDKRGFVELSSIQDVNHYEVIRLASQPNGLGIRFDKKPNGNTLVSVELDEKATTGFYTVKCFAEDKKSKKQSFTSFVVMVSN